MNQIKTVRGAEMVDPPTWSLEWKDENLGWIESVSNCGLPNIEVAKEGKKQMEKEFPSYEWRIVKVELFRKVTPVK